MTTLPGLASKGEKGKSKFQSLDINNLYRVSRGESLEPHAAKSALPRKHGMQSLGKVPSARRPANLPSLKAETSGGSDTAAVSLVPTTGGTPGATPQGPTWGKASADATNTTVASTPTTSHNTSISPVKNTAALGPGGLTPHQAAIALPVTTTIPAQSTKSAHPNSNSGHQQQLQTSPQQQPTGASAPLNTHSQTPSDRSSSTYNTQAHDKSWSAVMSGSDLPGVGQPPPYQSAQFQHEFPSLSAGGGSAEGAAPATAQRGGADTQYGPGPSLRPQTEGSWMQGGCGAPGATPEGANSAQQGSAPAGHLMQQPPPPQYRGLIPPFMFRGSFPPNGGPGGGPMNQLTQQTTAIYHAGSAGGGMGAGMPTPGAPTPMATGGPRGGGPNAGNRYRGSPGQTGVPTPVVLDELVQRPIIREEDLNRMDDMSRDVGWAAHDDIDYNQKLAFSDDEGTPEPETRKESSRQSSLPPKEPEKLTSVHEQPHHEKPSQSRGWNQSRGPPLQQDIRNLSSMAPSTQSSTGLRNNNRPIDEEEVWVQRRKQHSEEISQVVERAKQRKEEEEKRFQKQREAAAKKLQELENKLKDKKTIDGKTFEESQGTINPATVPPQVITPVPIPVPDWEKERECRERERERENVRERDEPIRSNAPQISDFRQLTQIEGRSLIRNDGRSGSDRDSTIRERDGANRERDGGRDSGRDGGRDGGRDSGRDGGRDRNDMSRTERERDRDMREQREGRDGPNFSRHFQSHLPPRFQKQQAERHRATGGSGSPQPPQQSNQGPPSSQSASSNMPFAQQYDPRCWLQSSSQPNRRHRNDSDIDEERRETRRERHTPDDGRYNRQHNSHRAYSDAGSRKSGSSSDNRDYNKDSRDSRERDIREAPPRDNRDLRDNRESRERDTRYYDDYRSGYRNQDYEYEKRDRDVDADRWEHEIDRQYDDRIERNIRTDDKKSNDPFEDARSHERDIIRQDSGEWREENRRDIDRNRMDDNRRQPMHHQDQYDRDERRENRDDRVRDMDRPCVRERDERYRDERPQRPDSRDSRASRESRHSRDSMRDLDTSRDYTGSWADERAPFEEEKRKESYRDERDRRVPGPITREKMEADELRSEKRNLTQLKRSTSGQCLDSKKTETKKLDDKLSERKPPAGEDAWVITKKETTPVRSSAENVSSPKAWADAISPSTIAPENVKLMETIERESNQGISLEKTVSKPELKDELGSDNEMKKVDSDVGDGCKEKDDKRGVRSAHSRGGRDNRGNRGAGWGSSSYAVYRGSWGGGPVSSGNRRGPPRMSGTHRPPSSRSGGEWRQSDSELSGEEISASTESGKDERGGQRQQLRSPKPAKKLDKDDKNRELRQDKSASSISNTSGDRRFDKSQRNYESGSVRSSGSSSREGFIPRGEPSRRGRGSFRTARGGSSTGKRMDGYGPPPTKSPFGQQSTPFQHESDKEKKFSGDEIGGEIFSSDEKAKMKQQALTAGIIGSARNQKNVSGLPNQVPPRMQHKSDQESRRERSKGRGSSGSRKQRPKSGKGTNSDEFWETTSENSDTENERKDSRNGRKVSVGSKSGSNSSSTPGQLGPQRQNSNNSTTSNNSSSNVNRGRSGSQSNNTSRAPGAEKRSSGCNNAYQGRSSNQSQTNRQNSSGSLRSGPTSKEKDSQKDVDSTEVNNYSLEGSDATNEDITYSQCDADGFQEVRSKKNVKTIKDEKEKVPLQPRKSEKETGATNVSSTRGSKGSNSGGKLNGPVSQIIPQQISSNPPLQGTQMNPPPKNQFEQRSRPNKLPPRFVKQRENIRLHKVLHQGMCDVNEMNKINQNVSMYAVKDGTTPMPSGNAWDKPITAQLRTNLDQDALTMAIDNCVDLDHTQQSGASSQRSSPNTDGKSIGKIGQVQDKSVLDGTTPPVNTIIFENTNYKSAPGVAGGDLAMKAKFNSHMKNNQRMDKNRTNKLDDGDIENQTMLAFNKPINDLIDKKTDPIQLPMSFHKPEDSADMKLDFTFDSELSQLTDDKTGKGLGLPKSMHSMTSAQSTISPSTVELNFKIAAVKKVWETMPTVLEQGTVAQDDGNVNTSASFASALDPSTAFNKPGDSDESHEVYSPSPSHMANVASNNNTNVCKVKPTQQQTAGGPGGGASAGVGNNSGHHLGGGPGGVPPGAGAGHIGPAGVAGVNQGAGGPGQQPGTGHMGSGHPLSPPPPVVMGLGQPPQAYTGANQHINYQPNLAGNAQYGGMSAIPSPPTVQFNISPHPTQGNLYGAFQMDQGRSQFSQFPPPAYGMGQTASTPYNTPQSMYLQTGPHPPSAQPPPEMYQSMSSYRMAATGPFGQSQQINNNPSTVLISSTSNSLMSASVKPSSQQIGAIGTKAGAVGQGYGAQSQQGGQMFLPYDAALQASYIQRGPGGPVQNNVVPAPIQASNSYYSASANAQTGFYQQPGSSALPSAPLHQHQTSFGLQTNVFGGHSGSTAGGLPNFGSQFHSSPLQMAAAINAQQYRTQQGSVSGLTNPGGGVLNAQPQGQNARPQQLKSPGGQTPQDMLSVFSALQQHQQQQNSRHQSNMNMSVSGRSQQMSNQGPPGAARYPAPIQRPPVSFQPAPGAMSSGGTNQRSHRSSQAQQQNRSQAQAPRQQQYYGGQSGTVAPSQQDKSDDIKMNDANSVNNLTNANNVNSTSSSNSLANKPANANVTNPTGQPDGCKDPQSTKEETSSKNE